MVVGAVQIGVPGRPGVRLQGRVHVMGRQVNTENLQSDVPNCGRAAAASRRFRDHRGAGADVARRSGGRSGLGGLQTASMTPT